MKYGGYTLHAWLLSIFTAILRFESIPPSLKLGVIKPLYKGKGCDPLDPNSYRGVTLSSVVSKCLEKAILHRMEMPLKEAGFPHLSQTTYQRAVSCSDAIFSTQEALLKFVREGDETYLCLYDLEKAFDSIEFPILLSHLFKYRINGKCWRLSPTLFLIVMDSLLCSLYTSGLNLSVNGLTIGSAAHADDIRSTSNSIADLQGQRAIIEQFTLENSLKLNASKTELIKFSANAFISEGIQLTSHLISTQPTAKCLGYWWHTNLSLAKSIAENISTEHSLPWVPLVPIKVL